MRIKLLDVDLPSALGETPVKSDLTDPRLITSPHTLSPQTDIYSFGAILRFLVNSRQELLDPYLAKELHQLSTECIRPFVAMRPSYEVLTECLASYILKYSSSKDKQNNEHEATDKISQEIQDLTYGNDDNLY